MSMNTIRHPNGTIYFVDELGADHLGDYLGGGIALSELIEVTETVFGDSLEINAREFDIASAIAERRWERKKNEIVEAVVKALKE